MFIQDLARPIPEDLYWDPSDVSINKDDYVQPIAYMRAFHRLWDNIELIRSSLYFEPDGRRAYKPPVHAKEEIVVGQNEFVTNSVINRLIGQIRDNLMTLLEYFKF
jgi:hypothetical protein